MNALVDALLALGPKLAAHVLLSASALAAGIIAALALALWARQSPLVARLALGFASLVQTIPALALLALFFPILLSLRTIFGEGLPTLGFLPALLALALYALLPILRNSVTALANLDPAMREAADAVGMTSWQRLALVEAPLSAPYVMAGIRTAAVWTIGAATLSTTIGQPSLGDPIFAGLQTQNWALVLAGCVASALLALAADFLLGRIEGALALRRPLKALAWGALILAGVGLALFAQFDSKGEDRIVIGAKGFSEQYVLARLIGQRLEAAGYRVSYRDGLGSAVAHSALTSSDIDILVDYTGTIWTNQMKRTDNPDREAMLRAITQWESARGVRVLGRLGFENTYAFAMKADRSRALGIASIGDLARHAPRLVIGGDPEFFERPEWRAVQNAYQLRFARKRNFAPTFMYDALRSGEADVIGAYSSDGRIAADGLAVLDDPKRAFPNYDAIVLIAPKRAHDQRLIETLKPLIGKVEIEAMRRANYAVDRKDDKLTPSQAARRLAREIGL